MKTALLLLALSFVLVSCGDEKPQPVSETQWEVFGYLPSDTRFVLYTNLGELRKTEHWENIIKPSLNSDKTESWLNEFEEATGAGINEGVSEVYTATTWNSNDIFVIRFSDNGDRVREYFKNDSKFNSEEISGKKVYSIKINPESKFYFVNSNTLLIIKNIEYLSALIAGKNESLIENKKMISLIKSIKHKNHYWIATTQGDFASSLLAKFFGSQGDLPVNKVLNSLDNITMAAEFSKGVTLESTLGCKDKKSAYLITTAIRSAIAMDILSDSNYELGKIIQSLDISHSDKNIDLELIINEKDILELQNINRKRQTDNNL